MKRILNSDLIKVKFFYTEPETLLCTYVFPVGAQIIPDIGELVLLEDIELTDEQAKQFKEKTQLELFDFDYFIVNRREYVFDSKGCIIDIFVVGQYLEDDDLFE